MTDFQSATAVPVFMEEEDGWLNAYAGYKTDSEHPEENAALLASVRLEAMNMVQPPSAALDAFRSLVRLLGAAVQGEVRAQVTRELLSDVQGVPQ
jgi:hypothetical protein